MACHLVSSRNYTIRRVDYLHCLPSRRVASRRVASRRVASRRVASRRVASRRVASRRVASRRVASRRVASRCYIYTATPTEKTRRLANSTKRPMPRLRRPGGSGENNEVGQGNQPGFILSTNARSLCAIPGVGGCVQFLNMIPV